MRIGKISRQIFATVRIGVRRGVEKMKLKPIAGLAIWFVLVLSVYFYPRHVLPSRAEVPM
jgi:hypothetical protein